MSQAELEAAQGAYVENYLDCLESLPDCVQRHISELRRLDSETFATFNAITTLREGQKKFAATMSPSEVENLDAKTMEKIQQLLLRYQNLSDEKLKELDEISELIDLKAQQLELNKMNLDGDKVEKRRSPQPSTSRLSQLSLTDKLNGDCSLAAFAKSSDCVGSSGNMSDTVSIDSSNSAGKKAPEKSAGPTSTHRRAKRQRLNDSTGASPSGFSVDYHPPNEPSPPAAPAKRNGSAKAASTTEEKSNGDQNNGKVEKEAPKQQKLKSRRKRKASNVGNTSANKDVPVDPDEPTYCLCDQISYGDMIGCDNSKCELEWFHFSCVGLAAKPKGKWYCPNCRGDKPNSLRSATSKK